MKYIIAIAISLWCTTIAAIAQPAPATPAPSPQDGTWHLAVAPYVWLPNINGTLSFKRRDLLPVPPGLPEDATISIQAGPSNYLSNLNFGTMLAFEARRYGFSVFGDYINANLSTSVANVRTIRGPGGIIEAPLSSSVNTHMFSGIFSIGAGAMVVSGRAGNIDVGAGLRNVNVHVSADYSLVGPIAQIPVSGSLDSVEQLTDVTLDVRGRLNLGSRWYVPYYADLGTGNNNTTWQYLFGVAYAGRTNDVILGYRSLGYNQNGDQLLQNVRFAGPMLGLRVHW